MNIEGSFKNLYKKMDATSKTRFYASRRLKLHAKASTYTVVFISLALIFVSLLQAYDLGVNIHSKYTSLVQVFAAIAVLVYSLLIDKNEYAALSEKMYSCASKLGELKQRMHPYKESGDATEEKYNEFQKEYWSVLELYETHSSNDFSADNLRARLDMPEDYGITGRKKIETILDIYRMHVLNFISYPLAIIPLLWSIKWLWLG
ncbi:SLATT domain-containing protein [Thalassolituus alkanivorans]|uniref:SLATT domain-containing protein n=1 Tax=Thalassolituus alkanivorans TaxID=2881055 RepID=UPI001E6264E6|nr:SLATT domain-containing protein [Thalassolituus alkanivorans]MCB2385614.1 SLATT domain-containing protein [Thalassolituus alkanivorans]MCB2424740.1 SLATT domain-containing protein [Thalassolituus alkanivorans]